ncbi:leucine-rich repeat domain-containing protein [Endobacterium cereale]|uniref:leucine-rich repeat domain-containing protein n=1 Tax=Endobacterium cereale TaxID=2663029 RepID=UPI00397B1821
MRVLSLAHTGVSDLTPLQDLINLRRLDIVGTRVTDFTPLRHLPDLEQLRIGQALSERPAYGQSIETTDLDWRTLKGREAIEAFLRE